RDPAAAERERKLGQGGAARTGAHCLRPGAGSASPARRHERQCRDLHRPPALARVAVRHDARGGRAGAGTTSVTAPPGSSARRTLVTICAMSATIMQALDTTIANVALPYMQG